METQIVWTTAIFRKVISKISECIHLPQWINAKLFYHKVVSLSSLFSYVGITLLISDCFWMLDALLEYTSTGHLPSIFKDHQSQLRNKITDLPQRMEGNHLYR